MDILIVEDDLNKLTELTTFVEGAPFFGQVREAKSYRSGLKAIVDGNPGIVILDMSMPTFDVTSSEKGGRPRPFGGREILQEMRRLKIDIPVIVVTQFETFGEDLESMSLSALRMQLSQNFPENYMGTVYYHPAQSDWKKELADILIAARGRSVA